jgi:hypothetical protein
MERACLKRANLKNYLKSDAQRRPWRYHPDVSSTLSEKEKCEENLKAEDTVKDFLTIENYLGGVRPKCAGI